MSGVVLEFPAWLLAVVIIAGFALLAAALSLGFRRLVREHRDEGHNEIIGLFFNAAAILYAVVLAFVIFGAWDRFTEAQRVASDEAASVSTLYLDASDLPPAQQAAARDAIRSYATSVITDEWPALASGQASARAQEALVRLHEVIGRAEAGSSPPASGATPLTDKVDELTSLRAQRIALSRSALPDVLWVTLIVGGIAVLLLAAPLFMHHGRHQVIPALLLGAVLGAILFLVVVLDHPFAGNVAVSPDDLQRDLHMFSA